jgi:hypothetical protein
MTVLELANETGIPKSALYRKLNAEKGDNRDMSGSMTSKNKDGFRCKRAA